MIAVLGQPGTEWTSQRDHLLLSLLYNTGARVSEIVGVRVVDVVLDGAACVHLHGKGRKPKFRSLKVRSAVSGRDASCRINGLAETPERFHENAVVSRFPTYGF